MDKFPVKHTEEEQYRKNNMDFQRGKIYVIKNNKDEQVYVGSTTKSNAERWKGHMDNFKAFLKGEKCQGMKLYNHMKTIGIEHFFLEIIEVYPCNDLTELRLREGYWVKKMNPALNSVIPGGNKFEWTQRWRDNNKEYSSFLYKKWLSTHQEHRKKYMEKWDDKFVCLCGANITRRNKARHEKISNHIMFMEFYRMGMIEC